MIHLTDQTKASAIIYQSEQKCTITSDRIWEWAKAYDYQDSEQKCMIYKRRWLFMKFLLFLVLDCSIHLRVQLVSERVVPAVVESFLFCRRSWFLFLWKRQRLNEMDQYIIFKDWTSKKRPLLDTGYYFILFEMVNVFPNKLIKENL
jgi:hypothetical protein